MRILQAGTAVDVSQQLQNEIISCPHHHLTSPAKVVFLQSSVNLAARFPFISVQLLPDFPIKVRFRNYLQCVGWGVKLYSFTPLRLRKNCSILTLQYFQLQ